jgi:hypothetical protein
VSRSVWVILCLSAFTALILVVGMMVSLNQLQEHPAAHWVKLAEATTARFNLEKVSVRVDLVAKPTSMQLSYLTKTDTKFDTTIQNAEMDAVAQFAVNTYKGNDLHQIENVLITRSETHGSGCFQETYVAKYTYVNPRRTQPSRFGLPVTPQGTPFEPPPKDPGDR